MRIVLFNKQEKSGGGIGVVTARLRGFLEKKGHEVYEIRYSNEPESNSFIKIPYIFADRHTFVYLPSIKTKKIIEDHLKRLRPDLIFLPVGVSTFDFLLPRMARKLGIPLYGVSHVDISRSSRLTRSVSSVPLRLFVPFCQKLDVLQVFSKHMKKYYAAHGVRSSRIVVIPNWVDTQKYSPGNSSFKTKHGIKKGVIFMGRVDWIKDPEVLIKSFLNVADPTATLIIMGKGKLEAELKEKYGSGKNILFVGYVRDEKRKIDIMRACGIFVLPSRFEGMSLSLLESMAAGLYCITSDVGSHKEVLRGVGKVIPYHDIESDLPVVLRKAFDDWEMVEELGRKARKEAIRKYSEQDVFNRLLFQFEKLALNT